MVLAVFVIGLILFVCEWWLQSRRAKWRRTHGLDRWMVNKP